MRVLLVAALLLPAAACSAFAFHPDPYLFLPPQVVARITEHWYPVTGNTVTAMSESLQHNALEWERNHAYALTTWRAGWKGRTTSHQNACRLVNVQVNVAVETTLPRWVDGEHGTHQARARWQEFESAIQAHEDGHRAMAYQAGAALLKRLEELQAPYCVTLDQRAEEEATALLAVFRDRDRSYDRRTERGRLQGVVW